MPPNGQTAKGLWPQVWKGPSGSFAKLSATLARVSRVSRGWRGVLLRSGDHHSQDAPWNPGPGALVEVLWPCLSLRSRSLVAAAPVRSVPSGVALGHREPRLAGALSTAADAPLGGAQGPRSRIGDLLPDGCHCWGEPHLWEGQGGWKLQNRRQKAAGAWKPEMVLQGLGPRVPGNSRPASPVLGELVWTPD